MSCDLCFCFVYGIKGRMYIVRQLLFAFDGEATLSDFMLSKDFPYNVSISDM
ncbi:hypothetical protein Sjap_008102 [Stephania japonica]|uniref:Uncharacterized protein n=1 Tax=Stephania japonica TaxID=461633 RepID=A0AAP0JQE9_9MAGN